MADHQTLTDVARDLSVTADQLRYWVKLAGVTAPRQGRERVLSPAAVDTMKAMAQLVAEGVAPGEAARRVGGVASVVADFTPAVTPSQQTDLTSSGRIEQLEHAVMALVEAHRQEAEKARADVTLLLEAQRLADDRHRQRVEALEARLATIAETQAREAAVRRLEAERAQQDAHELKRQAAWTHSEVGRLTRREAIQTIPSALLETPTSLEPWQPPPPAPRVEGLRRWIAHLVNPATLRRR